MTKPWLVKVGGLFIKKRMHRFDTPSPLLMQRYDVYDGNANGDGLFLTNDTG